MDNNSKNKSEKLNNNSNTIKNNSKEQKNDKAEIVTINNNFEDKKKTKNRAIIYCLYFALTIAILVVILQIISKNDITKIGKALATADIRYVFIALGFLLLYLAIYPISLCLLARVKKLPAKFSDVYFVGMTEHFFNGITPFATGGQPFQAYALTKKKVKVADSTSLLIMNFIIFMTVTNTFALISLIYFDKFTAVNNTLFVVSIVGFAINFTVLLCTIALGTSKKVKNLIVWFMKVLSKIKFLTKLLEDKIEDFNTYCENTQAGFKELWKHKGTCIACYFVKALAMACNYIITFYVIKALHVDIGYDKFFFALCGTSFATTAVVFMPTPGSSGGIELAFTAILFTITGATDTSLSASGMLIWRLLTYYLAMAISFCFYIIYKIKISVNNKTQMKNQLNSIDKEETK